MPAFRRSIRLPDYDYAQPGAYFVTLVTHNRDPVFARIVGGEIHITDIGRIAGEEWFRSADLRPYVRLEPDEFVVMPNHIHGIIWIVEEPGYGVSTSSVVAQRRCAATQDTDSPHVTPGSLGAIIRAYKSAVSYRVNAFFGTRGAPLWQRNYYEHILRSDAELYDVRAYIRDNPLRWDLDRENPAFQTSIK